MQEDMSNTSKVMLYLLDSKLQAMQSGAFEQEAISGCMKNIPDWICSSYDCSKDSKTKVLLQEAKNKVSMLSLQDL
jgi:hypothetical protein